MAAILPQSSSSCPFCSKPFLRIGNHLLHCQARNGADYSIYLSQKTLRKKLRPTATSSIRQKCPKCQKLFKCLDTHLSRSAICRTQVAVSSETLSTNISRSEPSDYVEPETEPRPQVHNDCASASSSKDRLKLPRTTEEWSEANQALKINVTPKVLMANNIEVKNSIICDGIYSVFSSCFGTKPSHFSTEAHTCYKSHNRELKSLQKKENPSSKIA